MYEGIKKHLSIAQNLNTTRVMIKDNITKIVLNLDNEVLSLSMKYVLSSYGKMYRSFLIFGLIDMFNQSIIPFIDIATAVELIHTYTLVHDDLPAMDNDDMRRGQLSCHKKFGVGTAILTGNALLTLGFHLLSKDNIHIPPMIRINIISCISNLIGFILNIPDFKRGLF